MLWLHSIQLSVSLSSELKLKVCLSIPKTTKYVLANDIVVYCSKHHFVPYKFA